MLEQLILLHFPGPATPGRAPAEWLEWNTCQRTLWIRLGEFPGAVPQYERGVEGATLYRGVDAYRFLLELVSGLHSRLLGENEIVGQFKKRFLQQAEGAPTEFLILVNHLLADVKRVRSQVALNTGSHSYGSFCRKALQGLSRISLVGTGELAASVLPWLAQKDSAVQVLYRSEGGAQALLAADFAQRLEGEVTARALAASDLDLSGGLVLAAPLTSADITALLARANRRPQQIVDCRGESDSDRLECGIPVIRLSDFFEESRRVAESSSAMREQAMAMVADLSRARESAIQIRTQGWEDLCG